MIKQTSKLLGIAGLLFMCGVAQGVPIEFKATLSGAAESPANASPGTGFADVFYDSTLHTLQLSVTFSGLLGNTTASHIHAATTTPGVGTAGVATTTPTFAGFPLGVTSGTYNNTLDLTSLSSYNSSYVTANGGTAAGAEAALVAAMMQGRSYLNIHTSVFAGGEIRGFLAAVPDTAATAMLLILSLAGIAVFAQLQSRLGKSTRPRFVKAARKI